MVFLCPLKMEFPVYMRVLKNDKYESILRSARQEFIRKGFKNTSMRDIAQKSRVGLSNIYNYFKNKDEIFQAVVNPAKREIFAFVTKQHQEESMDLSRSSVFGHQEEVIEYFISLVDKYRDELHLLLHDSRGSSMENFREMFTDHITHISLEYMEIEKRHYNTGYEVSHFFIHIMSSWMVNVLGEIVIHKLDRREIREFFREYFRFEYAGWCGLTGT